MQRFSNFNQMLTSNSNENENEDDDDDLGDGDDDTTTGDDDKDKDSSSTSTMKVEKVELKEVAPLEQEYIDNSYWDLNKKPEEEDIDYDSLLAELES